MKTLHLNAPWRLKLAVAITVLITFTGAAWLAFHSTLEKRRWINRYANEKLISGKHNSLKLAITAVLGEDAKSSRTRRSRSEIIYGTEVKINGKVSDFSHTSLGISGKSGDALSPSASRRLDALLARLPGDSRDFPPPNRRLLVQASVGGKAKAHVYDRANMPGLICEILHLCECPVQSYVPLFEPKSRIKAHGDTTGGFMRVAPDGRQILFGDSVRPLQFWDTTTHELLREIQGCNWQSIAFSPRDRLAVVDHLGDCRLVDADTWQPIVSLAQGYAPRFIDDGRFILLTKQDGQLACYDVATRHRVDLPEIAPNVVKYIPSPRIGLAVCQAKRGGISLWDGTAQREMKSLAPSAELLQAAFSPDESLVAVAYRSEASDDFSITIGIWQTATGIQLHALRPFEQRAEGTEGIQALFWSPDAKYVLAADTAPSPWGSSGAGISVFSARTGRHRGQFTGCGKMNGAALLPHASELVAADEDGKIYFWDFVEAMKQVDKFEHELNDADL